jgi:hypothetical protein
MHYYTFSALIFANGQIKNALNLLHKSETPATIVEFRKQVEHSYAGPPETYSAVIIPTWEKIDEATYNHINEDFLSQMQK